MANFAAVSTSETVYIVGGYAIYAPGGAATFTRCEGCPKYITDIAKYENGAWSMAGNLQSTRRLHSAILLGDEIYVNGGASSATTGAA